MVASDFLQYTRSFSVSTYVGVEDLGDRANFQWNVIVLLISATLVSARQFFRTPIACYFPVSLSGGNMESYIEDLCWIEGTFPINLTSTDNPVPQFDDWSSKNPKIMNYYQWVPLVLALQAIAYYLPRIIWNIFVFNRTGADLIHLVKVANRASSADEEQREKAVVHVARSLTLLLFSRREVSPHRQHHRGWWRWLPGKRRGNKLIYVYVFFKLIYVLIGAAQLHFMYVFLGFNRTEGYFFFAFKILDDMRHGRMWAHTQVFPLLGVCRHSILSVSSKNTLFAQCVLPINMLNEKIYIFLYLFLGAVMIFQLLTIPLWLYRISAGRQRHFIKRFLKIAGLYNRDDPQMKALIRGFVEEFLRQDGHFILRMLSMNAGDLIAVEIVTCLFRIYRNEFHGRRGRGGCLVTQITPRDNAASTAAHTVFIPIPPIPVNGFHQVGMRSPPHSTANYPTQTCNSMAMPRTQPPMYNGTAPTPPPPPPPPPLSPQTLTPQQQQQQQHQQQQHGIPTTNYVEVSSTANGHTITNV